MSTTKVAAEIHGQRHQPGGADDLSLYYVKKSSGALTGQPTLNGQPLRSGYAAKRNYLVGVSGDPKTANNNNSMTLGEVYLARIIIEANATVSSFWFGLTAAGTGMTSNQNFCGIYDTSGNLLSVSADMTSKVTSTGPKKVSLLTPLTVTEGQELFGAIVCNGTTSPKFMGWGQGYGWTHNIGPGVDGYPAITSPFDSIAPQRYSFMSWSASETSLRSTINLSYGNPDQAFFMGLS